MMVPHGSPTVLFVHGISRQIFAFNFFKIPIPICIYLLYYQLQVSWTWHQTNFVAVGLPRLWSGPCELSETARRGPRGRPVDLDLGILLKHLRKSQIQTNLQTKKNDLCCTTRKKKKKTSRPDEKNHILKHPTWYTMELSIWGPSGQSQEMKSWLWRAKHRSPIRRDVFFGGFLQLSMNLLALWSWLIHMTWFFRRFFSRLPQDIVVTLKIWFSVSR